MRTHAARGFTLIELMIVVAIIGILASVAIPGMQKASLRAKRAERETIVDLISRGTGNMLVQRGQFPIPFIGLPNPAGAPGSSKRQFNTAAAGWTMIDVQIEGAVYHSYSFEGDQTATPKTLTIMADGDLDGDAAVANRTVVYEILEGAMLVQTDDVSDDSVF